jgi:hypothetical protein
MERACRKRTRGRSVRRVTALGLVLATASALAPPAHAIEFNLRQVANERLSNRDPVLSEAGVAAWITYDTNDVAAAITDLAYLRGDDIVSLGQNSAASFYANAKPVVQSNAIVWIANYRNFPAGHSWILQEVPNRDDGATEIPALYRAYVSPTGEKLFENLSFGTGAVSFVTNNEAEATTPPAGTAPPEQELRRHPSGDSEVNFWAGTGDVVRVSTDRRHDFAPSFWGRLIAWQKEKGFPFGWEVMIWDDGVTKQLTTNYYYDMAPKVQGRQVVWYGWDGYDFEIFLYDANTDQTIQITSNRYDDVGPVLWDGVVAWEGYPAVEADIFLYKDGQVSKISDNVEDDINPRIWNGQVVWQAFDGDDFEIYLYDGTKSVKVTKNNFDDTNPDIRDGLITWMGYEGNWDAEIYAWDGTGEPARLTENEEEDRDPKTASRRIIWSVEREGKSQIWLADPK